MFPTSDRFFTFSDDSTPGAIPSLTNSTTIIKSGGNDEINDNPMKRYLQCPGMCRIEVLKKFVRNKYNVDTNLFHVSIEKKINFGFKLQFSVIVNRLIYCTKGCLFLTIILLLI